MDKIRLGVFGLGRGKSLFSSMLAAGAEIVAVCEKDERRIEEAKKIAPDIAVYNNFDEFIEHPMDAVMLCNYFNEHAEYAVRCLEKNLHVLSETMSNTTMADGVKLVRAAEYDCHFEMTAQKFSYRESFSSARVA